MFWTTDGVEGRWGGEKLGVGDGKMNKDMTRWDAYVDVCSGIQPSWADGIMRND